MVWCFDEDDFLSKNVMWKERFLGHPLLKIAALQNGRSD